MGGLSQSEADALETAARFAGEYRRAAPDRPVAASKTYAAVLEQFREPFPETGMHAPEVVTDLVRRAEGGLLGTVSPNFHGWVIGASHPVGVAADWLASAWGQVASFADIAPASCAAEEVAADWIVDMLALPAGSQVGFATGATMANFAALAAARTHVLDAAGWDVEAKGLFGAPDVHVVVGGEAHSSIFLTLRYLGFGSQRVHVAASDDQGRMRPDALRDVLAGVGGPTIVILQAGNVNSGAFDPFGELIGPAREAGAWIHVDGAFGLWAAAAPSLRDLTAGMADADSWAADAHKWLQAPYDCGVAISRNGAAMRRALGSTAAYLPQVERRNPCDLAPELSRRARGLPVWAILKHLGREGVAEMIERNCAVARRIAERLSAEPGLAVLNDVVLNQVAVACGEAAGAEADDLTRRTLAAVQAGGVAYPTAGNWRGREIMRISVSAGSARLEDGDRTAAAVIAAWRETQGAR
ncbi:pyridoxal phosphate-dependent decarboxylase family protein [Microbaculum marinum]|uniref:Aminotransferase class V-fold PLP-dependent enzyme n=1 Tax=Microbaculum marinum TaxID=1764581 RepID=A0AAW9RHJ4_9HYPH